MNSIDSSNAQFLASTNLLQARADRAQNQISSGSRVNRPSDDPTIIADILALQGQIDRTGQVEKNLSSVKAEVDSADTSLSQALVYLQNAIDAGAQGAGTLATAQSRLTLSQQVEGILEQVVGLSRTEVAGRFTFSGDSASQPSYAVNLQNPNGVDRLVVTSATRLIQDASGTTFSASVTAQDIFDHRNPNDTLAGDNVFAALNQLRLALKNNDTAGISSSIDALKKGQDLVSQHLGFYGAVQNRIASATAVAQKYQLDEQAALSAARDTDVPAAILELTQARTGLEAAMQAQGRRPTTSLFDFLK